MTHGGGHLGYPIHTVCIEPQQVHSIQRNFQSSAYFVNNKSLKLSQSNCIICTKITNLTSLRSIFPPAVSENGIDADVDNDRSKLMTIVTLSFGPFQVCHYRDRHFLCNWEWNLSKPNSKYGILYKPNFK